MPGFGRKLIPALLVAGVTTTAGAQQKACDVDEGTPAQVAKAILSLQMAQGAQKPEDANTRLKDAVKQLTDGDMTKNPTGRAFVLGKALVAWSLQPSMASGMTTRGAVGFLDNPTAPYDLYAGIDSAFTVVETANPDCASQTAPWRQQKAWVDLVNHAIELSNAGKMDSAAIVAKRSLLLSRNSPYGYMVLAQAAQKNNQPKEAIQNYKESVAAATDTAQAETRRQLEYTLASYAAGASESATGADKAAFAADAKAAYEGLAKDPGTKYADAARQGLAQVAQLTGDTAAIKSSYAPQLANPSAFSYNSLVTAAVTAARANQTKDAITLFEAARATNPYHRDVLYNLSRLYILDSAYAKGIPVARQLVAVDPSNPDDYQLLAIAYATLQRNYQVQQKGYDSTEKVLGKRANTAKSPKIVKAAVDSAARINKFVQIYGDSAKQMVDSAIKYNTMMSSLPGHVAFNEFASADGKATIGGTISNPTSSPKSFDLKIDFLDKTGQVVNTQTVSVGPIEAGKSLPFKTEGTGTGIVAFRYAPLVAK